MGCGASAAATTEAMEAAAHLDGKVVEQRPASASAAELEGQQEMTLEDFEAELERAEAADRAAEEEANSESARRRREAEARARAAARLLAQQADAALRRFLEDGVVKGALARTEDGRIVGRKTAKRERLEPVGAQLRNCRRRRRRCPGLTLRPWSPPRLRSAQLSSGRTAPPARLRRCPLRYPQRW